MIINKIKTTKILKILTIGIVLAFLFVSISSETDINKKQMAVLIAILPRNSVLNGSG